MIQSWDGHGCLCGPKRSYPLKCSATTLVVDARQVRERQCILMSFADSYHNSRCGLLRAACSYRIGRSPFDSKSATTDIVQKVGHQLIDFFGFI